MICKHCYVIPKSLTKTLSNLRELKRKLRFLFYSGLLLFKGNGGRGQEQGGRGRRRGRGKQKRWDGDGGGRDEGSKDEGKGSGEGTGTGGTKTERTGTRTATGETDGGTETGSKVHHDKKRKLKKQHNNKQNHFRTHSIISGIKRSFFHQLNKTKV